MHLNHLQLAVHQDPQVFFSRASSRPVVLKPVLLQDIFPFSVRTLLLPLLHSVGVKSCSNPQGKTKVRKAHLNPHLEELPLAKHLGTYLSALNIEMLRFFLKLSTAFF